MQELRQERDRTGSTNKEANEDSWCLGVHMSSEHTQSEMCFVSEGSMAWKEQGRLEGGLGILQEEAPLRRVTSETGASKLLSKIDVGFLFCFDAQGCMHPCHNHTRGV